MARETVCLTGGSGFLGSWCCKYLLDAGHTVHTTVRSADKASYLKALPGATERLKIFDGVDLLIPGAFDAAMAGCTVCMHTASPFFTAGGSEESLVTPAVEGTRNVLASCAKAGVGKVVLTSSTAAIYVAYGTAPEDHVWSGDDWTDEALVREKSNWYCLSKTSAERLAWQLCKESGMQLCVLNPTLIFGPVLPGQPHLNTSQNTIVGMLDGSVTVLENACKSVVDVRDVAEAHVAAISADGAWGKRFIMIGASPHFSELARVVRDAVPDELKAKVPSRVSDTLAPPVMAQSPPNPVLYDVSPSEAILGIHYRGTQEMVASSVSSLLENGLTSTAMYAHKPGK